MKNVLTLEMLDITIRPLSVAFGSAAKGSKASENRIWVQIPA